MATGTQVRRVLLQIQADEGDSEAKIDAIAAKADELSNKHPELAVKIETAAASAKLRVLRAELTAATKPIEPKVAPKLDKIAALKAGAESGASTAQGMASGIGGSQYLIIGAVAAALAALPAVAASGGALIGAALAAKLLIGTKQVQGPLYKQFESMTQTLTSVMRTAALPLLQPLRQAFGQIGSWARGLQPVLARAFGSIGPLIQPMTRGLEALVSGVLPGFITLMRSAGPAVSAFASLLGNTGAGLGGLFKSLAPAIGPSSQLLAEVGRTIAILAPRVGLLSNLFASILGPALKLVNDLMVRLQPASDALVGPLTKVAQILVGGVASALTKLSGPLVQVATLLANQLGPVLPPIAAALAQVAEAAAGQLAASLTQMMPSITSVISALSTLLAKVILPILPNVLELALDFTQLTNVAIPLAGPVLSIAGALIQLLDAAVIPLMPQVQNLTNSLAVMADGAVRAFQMVSSVLSLFGVARRGGAEGSGHAGEGADSGPHNAGEAAGTAAGSAYGSAWAAGATGAATSAAKKAAARLPANLAAILAGGAQAGLTGTAAQVRAAIAKLIAAVTTDEKAGVITRGEGSALTLFLDKDSARLQSIATRRARIMSEIAAGQKYAATVAGNIRSSDDLQSAAAGGWNGGPQTTGQIISNLRLDVASIRKFAANIKRLQKLGLNRSYLDQLIQMGPDQGGQLAEQLADSGLGNIRQINAAESQIVQVSGYLGKTAANAMYDSGAMAGRGFLSGLEAQQAAITKMMQKIAKSMIDVLKHELGIHSPSTVTRDLARMTGAGIPLGLEDSLGSVRASAQRVARAMVPNPRGVAGAPGGAAAGVLQVEWVGGHQADQQFMTWLKKNIRFRGGDPGVTGR